MEDNEFEKIATDELPLCIYLKYDYLEPTDLIYLLSSLDSMYNHILSKGYPVFYSEKYQRAFRNFFQIDEINTGNSINIKLKEGWKPEFKIYRNDIVIQIPKLFGIPAIMLYALLLSGQKILDIQNQYLDNQIKQLELKVKKLELYERIQSDIEPDNAVTIYKKPNSYLRPRYKDTKINCCCRLPIFSTLQK
jgi:hypothetical protein